MLVTNPQHLSYQFNAYFMDSVDRILNLNKDDKQGRLPLNKISLNPNSMFLVPITEEEVLKVMNKLKGKYSSGYNEIPATLIEHCIQFIKTPLTFIFHLSLCSGAFPHLMMIAKVWSVFKKGRKQDCISNYRPIPIFPVFSKIFETLIHNRVVSFLNKYNLNSDAQNGFRVKKSTYTAIQTFLEDILITLDEKRFAMGIFLDLTKAFDVINHDLLLAKLELYGLRRKIHEWMSSYLMDRTQFVEIHHRDHVSSSSKIFTSSLKAIKRGVPRGSILGPLLFLLFNNDLPLTLHQAKVVLLADDTNILLTDNTLGSLNEKVIKVTELLESWFYENQLKINTDKTKVLFFHGRGPAPMYRPVICLNKRELLYSAAVKFLGIDISDNLLDKSYTTCLP
jgi:hypothetical protein